MVDGENVENSGWEQANLLKLGFLLKESFLIRHVVKTPIESPWKALVCRLLISVDVLISSYEYKTYFILKEKFGKGQHLKRIHGTQTVTTLFEMAPMLLGLRNWSGKQSQT